MAKPQVEDGYTSVANELLERLARISLAANQWQVLLVIMRKTYGFHKKVDYIANSQIVEATGLCKAVVSRALHILEQRNIITRNGKNIGIQKDWERWQELAKLLTVEKLAILHDKLAILSTELAESSTKVSSPRVAQKIKDTITKETIQKKQYGQFDNVYLTDTEYKKLIERFQVNGTLERIEILSEGIESKGYKYKNHYAAILAWSRRDSKDGKNGTNKQNPRELPKKYTEAPVYDDLC